MSGLAALATLCALAVGAGSAGATTQLGRIPGPSGAVNAISAPDAAGVRYVGGDFTLFDLWDTGVGAAVSTADGAPDAAFPKVSGTSVLAVASDGSGGFFVGGSFTCVGALNDDADCLDTGEYERSNLAHFTSAGAVDATWNPGASGPVSALVRSGTTLYVGGLFSTLGGAARPYLGAVSTTGSGSVTTWNPVADGAVNALALSGSTLYAGGAFLTIGGQTRPKIAALDTATGLATAWNPQANNAVLALATSGSTVYVAGQFTSVGGQSRNRIAALDATTNTAMATAWNPSANGTVRALAVSGSTVYVGGDFATVGGQSRSRIAALDATTNTNMATAWNPGAGASVYALAVAGSTVYAAGSFTTLGGEARPYLGAVSAVTGSATTWNPNANGAGKALALSSSGDSVYAGGAFTSMGGIERNRLAAIDADGYLTDWNPGATGGGVKTLLVDGSTVYVGGEFTAVGGQTRRGIASVGVDGALQAWSPSLNTGGNVKAIARTGDTLFLGGYFSTVGTVVRGNIAAVSLADSCTTAFADACVRSWNPSTTGAVRGPDVLTLNQVGDVLLLGGPFATVGASSRGGAAAVGIDATCLDAYTDAGCVRSWNPDFDERVTAVALVGDTAYIGGWFGTAGGAARTKTAAMKVDSACIASWSAASCRTAWNPTAGNQVPALAASGSTLYAGGPFSAFGGATRNRAAAVDISGSCAAAFSGACLGAWNPDASGEVNAIAASDSNVYLGGLFTTISGVARSRLAVIDADGTLRPGVGLPHPASAPASPGWVTAAVSGQVATVAFIPGTTHGSPIVGFTATCASSTGGATRTGTGSTSPIAVGDLTPGATYSCTVVADNALGTSAASAACAAFTVAGNGVTPSDDGASSTATAAAPAAVAAASSSAGRVPAVLRLRMVQPAIGGPGDMFITTGLVPEDVTSVAQIARPIASAHVARRATRTAACSITRRGAKRIFTCRLHLEAGAWVVTTVARDADGVKASATNRVRVRAPRPAEPLGPSDVTG